MIGRTGSCEALAVGKPAAEGYQWSRREWASCMIFCGVSSRRPGRVGLRKPQDFWLQLRFGPLIGEFRQKVSLQQLHSVHYGGTRPHANLLHCASSLACSGPQQLRAVARCSALLRVVHIIRRFASAVGAHAPMLRLQSSGRSFQVQCHSIRFRRQQRANQGKNNKSRRPRVAPGKSGWCAPVAF